ncbi:hypothetical protein N9230_06500, partial [Akkermansiaceae bacterium]|nr:hypothetical protein [Akkermansiaceae bacterium]
FDVDEWAARQVKRWPDLSGQLEEFIKFEINQVLVDLETIPGVSKDDSNNLISRFVSSIQNEKGAEQAITTILLNKDLRNFKPVIDAYQNTEGTEAEFTLWRIREHLADGFYSPNEIIQYYSAQIGALAKAGESNFFQRLGKSLASPPKQRSLGDWLSRGWLHLSLWECKNYLDAYERCKPIADAMNLSVHLESFETAFKNTKKRKRSGEFYEGFRTGP